MRARIHRGAREIGGTCVEPEAASGARIVVDLGAPLTDDDKDSAALPAVAGLADADDPDLLGVLISHPRRR